MGSGASGSVNRERKQIIIGAYQFARENTTHRSDGKVRMVKKMQDETEGAVRMLSS